MDGRDEWLDAPTANPEATPGDVGDGEWETLTITSWPRTRSPKPAGSPIPLVPRQRVQPVPVGDAASGKRGTRRTPRKPTGRLVLTRQDRALLLFLCRVKCASTAQLARFSGRSESALRHRLPRLRKAGLITSTGYLQAAGHIHSATKKGAQSAGSDLPVTAVKEGHLSHTLSLVDLVIAFEQRGLTVKTDREIRSEWSRRRAGPDGLRRKPEAGETIGDHLAALDDARNPDALPDIAVLVGDGRYIAVELERSRKSRGKVEKKIRTYLRNPDMVVGVWFYVSKECSAQVRNSITAVPGAQQLCKVVEWAPPGR